MIDLGLPQIVQSLKAQAWSDEVIICLIFKMLLNSLVQSKLPGKFKVPLSTMPFQFLSSQWMSEMAVLFRKCVTSFAIGLRFLAVKNVFIYFTSQFLFLTLTRQLKLNVPNQIIMKNTWFDFLTGR